jgi:hypothetical protein
MDGIVTVFCSPNFINREESKEKAEKSWRPLR